MTIKDKNLTLITLKINESKFRLNFCYNLNIQQVKTSLVIDIKAINVANDIHSKYMQGDTQFI